MTACSNCDVDGKHYVGEIGTVITLDTCTDLSSATTVSIRVEKPDGTAVIWAGEVYETTKVKHIALAGDLDQAGVYTVQPYVEMPGWSGKGSSAEFRILPAYG